MFYLQKIFTQLSEVEFHGIQDPEKSFPGSGSRIKTEVNYLQKMNKNASWISLLTFLLQVFLYYYLFVYLFQGPEGVTLNVEYYSLCLPSPTVFKETNCTLYVYISGFLVFGRFSKIPCLVRLLVCTQLYILLHLVDSLTRVKSGVKIVTFDDEPGGNYINLSTSFYTEVFIRWEFCNFVTLFVLLYNIHNKSFFKTIAVLLEIVFQCVLLNDKWNNIVMLH